MRAILFYFSGTGNTWWLAEKLADKLNERGVDTELVSIEEDTSMHLSKIKEYDIVGFGYPIYGSDCPLIYHRFLERLPPVEEKSAFIFTSMLGFSGDGALVAEKQLAGNGYKLLQAVNTPMMNNVKLPYPVMGSLPMYSEVEMGKIRVKAEKRMDRLAEYIVEGKKWIEGRGIIGKIGGLIQRSYVALTGWSHYARNFYVDKEACISCDQCVKYCPAGNISQVDEEYVWGGDCVCCLRCYNLCPVDAIQYTKATMNRNRYPRYKGPVDGFSVKQMKRNREK